MNTDFLGGLGDWLKRIDWIANLFFIMVTSIIVNLLTPRIQEWLEGVPIFVNAKRLQSLKMELEELTKLNANRSELYLRTISAACLAFIFFSVANAAWAFPGFYMPRVTGEPIDVPVIDLASNMVAIIFFLFTVLVCINHMRLISKVRYFDTNKTRLENRIKIVERKVGEK